MKSKVYDDMEEMKKAKKKKRSLKETISADPIRTLSFEDLKSQERLYSEISQKDQLDNNDINQIFETIVRRKRFIYGY